MDDVKAAIQQYVKACPQTTYIDLETAFRQQKIELYVIAVQKTILPTMTNMDLQGNLNKTFSVTFRFENRPARGRETGGWPKSPEENLVRLEDAGEVVQSGLPRCNNCGEVGHISKNCEQDRTAPERVVIKCFNCEEEGHRIRDCTFTILLKLVAYTNHDVGPQPRQDKFACKNCGESGHKAADCK